MFIGILSQGDAGTNVPHYWGRETYREIEGLGFDGLFCGERFATYHAPVFDCASLVTAMACATDHISIGTSAVVTSVRHPSLLAKEFACIDQIAGGRLILGVGIGGDLPSEFHAMGARLQGRGARASESIEIIRRYFRGERFSYHGKVLRSGRRLDRPAGGSSECSDMVRGSGRRGAAPGRFAM